MKKFTTLVLAMAMTVLSAFAQDGKKAILVAKFDYNPDFKEAYCNQVRSKVIEGLTATQRFRVIDMTSSEALQTEEQRRLAESAMNDVNARQQLMSTLAAEYIIRGEVTTVDGIRKVMDDGTVYYDGNIAFTIHLVNPTDGTNIASETFTHNSLTADTGSTPVEAVNRTCERIVKDMRTFVDNHLKLGGAIVAIDESKKDKAVTVYIDLGSDDGIQKGQKFEVFQEVDIAGEKSTKKIGELTAEEVVSGGRTLCKVNKGGEEIMQCSQKSVKMPVKTRATKDPLGSFLKAIN